MIEYLRCANWGSCKSALKNENNDGCFFEGSRGSFYQCYKRPEVKVKRGENQMPGKAVLRAYCKDNVLVIVREMTRSTEIVNVDFGRDDITYKKVKNTKDNSSKLIKLANILCHAHDITDVLAALGKLR